ncbi:MAG: hypothetical protein H0U05_03600 [Actinobacteria bacterium]|nr:hypothetical protein [Actinomycetota bacterium]
MSVINRRNAVLGYATLKVLERRRKQSKRNAPKIALYLALGLVSAGVLAGLVAVLVRRRRSESEPAAVDTDVGSQGESEIVGEQVAASPEPLPAA